METERKFSRLLNIKVVVVLYLQISERNKATWPLLKRGENSRYFSLQEFIIETLLTHKHEELPLHTREWWSMYRFYLMRVLSHKRNSSDTDSERLISLKKVSSSAMQTVARFGTTSAERKMDIPGQLVELGSEQTFN